MKEFKEQMEKEKMEIEAKERAELARLLKKYDGGWDNVGLKEGTQNKE